MGMITIGPKHLLSKSEVTLPNGPIVSISTQPSLVVQEPLIQTIEKEVIKYIEVPVEKIVEVIKEVEKEVVREVKVIEERIIEIPKEIIKEVITIEEKIVKEFIEIPVNKIIDRLVFKPIVPLWCQLVIGLETLAILALVLFK